MKKSALYILFLFLTVSLNAGNLHKVPDDDSSDCLKVKGRILNLKSKTDKHYTVELITSEGVVDSMRLKDGKQFRFYLKKNSYYAIRIRKAGYLDRVVSIYTDVPKDSEDEFDFRFDTELIAVEDAKKLNKDALDFPIAVVFYHEKLKCFYHCEKYTTDIKRKIASEKTF